MSRHSLPTVTLLLVSSLLFLLHPELSGSVSCPNSFPTNQETVAYLDNFVNQGAATNVMLGGWMWNNEAVCDNTLTVCSNFTDADTNRFEFNQLDFGVDGQNDPVHITTEYMCEMCPQCVLTLELRNNTNLLESMVYMCSSSSLETVDFTSNESFTEVNYRVTFDNSSSTVQCISIHSYRVWQYTDCPATVFQLANFPSTDPGCIATSTSCVDNAMSSQPAQAGCSDMSEWEIQVGLSRCECVAGFEPNNDNTTCNSCAAGTFKAEVGNEACTTCPDNQEPTADKTGCQCVSGYIPEGQCNRCAVNYFRQGGSCVECPDDSVRASGENENYCTCTGNRATASGSVTTNSSTMGCISCATGYTRSSTEANNGPCNLCAEDYFLVAADTCGPCPSGSGTADANNMDNCMCEDGRVTMGGSTTTSNMPCDNCPANMFIMTTECVNCPQYSSRALNDDVSECMCDPNSQTAMGSQTTSDPADGCTSCVPRFSRRPGSDQCEGVTVSFEPSIYNVKESESLRLMVVASPPPNDGDTISVSLSEPSGLTLTPAQVDLTNSAYEVMVDVTGYDDDVGLQAPKEYTVTIIDGTRRDTAQLNITDDDIVRAIFENSDYVISETAGNFELCVNLTLPAAVDVSVNISGASSLERTSPSEAISLPGLDGLSRVVMFTHGQKRQCLNFDVENDDIFEENIDEQYRLKMKKLEPSSDDRFEVDPNEGTSVTVTDDEEEEPEASSFPLTAIVGGIAGGVVLAIILAIVCITCLCIWSVNVKRQGFYPTHEDSQTAPTMLRYSASLRSISSQSVVIAEGRRAAAQQKENEFFV